MLTNPMFYAKMLFIVGGVLVMRLLRNIVFTDRLASGGAPPAAARKLAIASLACWFFAIVAGRLTAYPYLVEYYLAVGDGIATDIAGAVKAGIDSVLVTGGIFKKQADGIEALCRQHGAVPPFIMHHLEW